MSTVSINTLNPVSKLFAMWVKPTTQKQVQVLYSLPPTNLQKDRCLDIKSGEGKENIGLVYDVYLQKSLQPSTKLFAIKEKKR